jgi:stress response protein SCP2
VTELVAGANTPLPGGTVTMTVPGPFDLSALVTGSDGKVAGDADFVFYNQPSAPGVRLRPGAVTVDPARLRRGAARVVLVASPEESATPFGRLPVPTLTVLDRDGRTLARFRPGGLTTETVVQLGEIYHRGAGWRLRALGQGYADGLAGLARDFGVEVDDDGSATAGADGGGLLGEVVARTNAERARAGLVPLTVDRRLAAAAQAHTADMVARGFFAHETPDGVSVADRVLAAGYPYSVVAENIAAGQHTAAEVVDGWLDSPGHRANILNPAVRQIGVGFTPGGPCGTTWTQVFGTPR